MRNDLMAASMAVVPHMVGMGFAPEDVETNIAQVAAKQAPREGPDESAL